LTSGEDGRGYVRTGTAANCLNDLSSAATDLLQLAAHEVAAGRTGRGTLALTAAAQQLAVECGRFASTVVLWGMHRLFSIACGQWLDDHPDSTGRLVLDGTGDLTGHSCIMPKCMCQVAHNLYQLRQGVQALAAAVQSLHAVGSTAAGPAGAQPRTAEAVEGSLPPQAQQVQVLLQRQQPVDPVAAMEALKRLAAEVAGSRPGRLQLVGCSWTGCTKGGLHPTASSAGVAYTAESKVAGRKGVSCGGCGLARYCCPQHQKEDWPRHRHVCRRLARAQARAVASPAGGGGSAI
jgi:hypothetical protein